MQQITFNQVTPAIRALFNPDDMVISRCYQVLDGAVEKGTIFVHNLANPTWAAVQEAIDHALFLGGSIDFSVVQEVFKVLRKEGDVLVGMTADDPRISMLPVDPYYNGLVLEFYERPIGKGLDEIICQMPPDCELRRLDSKLILKTEWGPNDAEFYGGPEQWEKKCLGYVLMRGSEIISEATIGPSARKTDLFEPGVFTQPKHRGKGFGTIVSARLIKEIEAMGGRTFWNCDKANPSSSAIARKLGYTVEKEFRCLAWHKDSA